MSTITSLKGSSGHIDQSSSSACSSLSAVGSMVTNADDIIDADTLIAAEREKEMSAVAQSIIEETFSKKMVRIVDPKENILYRNEKRLCAVTVLKEKPQKKSEPIKGILKPWLQNWIMPLESSDDESDQGYERRKTNYVRS